MLSEPRMRGPLASVTLLVLLSGSTAGVGAFADAGHRVVGLIAEHHLRGARAVSEIRKILGRGETLADAAVWPDVIKAPGYEDDDSELFRLEHPAHDVYHYANLPFQATRYDPSLPGARPGDIVQTARECVRVLRGASTMFTEREALRLLAHLVGDLHQPLHVGTAFVAANGQPSFVIPQGRTGWRVTRGGNNLVYGPQDRFNLHSYWDAHAVNLAMRREEPSAYASRLIRDVRVEQGWNASGDADSWPEQWANDALPHAKTIHRGIGITAYLGPDEAGRTPHRWRIQQPAGYDDLARTLIPAQLAKAGYRLAAVLKAIWPEG
ncbi:MAG TPA: S1/P1 nuclease [Vicinamibacterales bacterium]|nr:S1/P1 nuclease [Vicinamibacterales bacterium]